MGENNVTDVPKTLYYAGELLNMLLVFDPISSDLNRLMSSDFKMPDVAVNLPQVTFDDALQTKQRVFASMQNRVPLVRAEEDKFPTFEGKTGP